MELMAVKKIGSEAMEGICYLAEQYPFPHNVLGRPSARGYVHRLLGGAEGNWYVVHTAGLVQACGHLGLYGKGDNNTHSLWKIRHPMSPTKAPVDGLEQLFWGLACEALRFRAGSVKVVLFLSEVEVGAACAAQRAGFVHEGTLKDYYRLGEECLLYGLTLKGSDEEIKPS